MNKIDKLKDKFKNVKIDDISLQEAHHTSGITKDRVYIVYWHIDREGFNTDHFFDQDLLKIGFTKEDLMVLKLKYGRTCPALTGESWVDKLYDNDIDRYFPYQ